MRQKAATGDQLVATIAERQHGVLTIAQLREAGITDSAVKRRARSGRLHRIHRGVYAPGHAGLSYEGQWMAATLACGGVLSHNSAAALWKLLPPRPGVIDVSVAGGGGRDRRKGIRVHRSRTLAPSDVTRRLGVPTTTPARTVEDMRIAAHRSSGGAVSAAALRQAIRQAAVLGFRIDAHTEPDRTRSELEHLFLRLCRQYGLPQPEVNVRIGSLLVDFLWSDRGLIVETDGYRYHRGRAAFEDDRDRDLQLKSLGYEVIRLSYRQIASEPDRVAGVLAPVLAIDNRPFEPLDHKVGDGG